MRELLTHVKTVVQQRTLGINASAELLKETRRSGLSNNTQLIWD